MIYFKALAHTVVEVGKTEICRALSGKLDRNQFLRQELI